MYLFIYQSFMFRLCGILDRPEHLLTVILAPGSADIDCQRDVSFLLFISPFLRESAECKSAFSPWRVGRTVEGERMGESGGRAGGGRQEGWWKRLRRGGGDKTCREGVVDCLILSLLCV